MKGYPLIYPAKWHTCDDRMAAGHVQSVEAMSGNASPVEKGIRVLNAPLKTEKTSPGISCQGFVRLRGEFPKTARCLAKFIRSRRKFDLFSIGPGSL